MAETSKSIPVQIDATVELGGIDSRAFWLDALDRASRSFLQNVLVFFGAGVTIVSVSWTSLLGAAALAALVSLILAVSTATALTSGNFLVDLADRAVRTCAGSLAAAIPVTGSITDIDWPASLTIAGTAVLLSVVTSLLTENRGTAKGLPTLAPVDGEVVEVTDTEHGSGSDEPSFDNGGHLNGPVLRTTPDPEIVTRGVTELRED